MKKYLPWFLILILIVLTVKQSMSPNDDHAAVYLATYAVILVFILAQYRAVSVFLCWLNLYHFGAILYSAEYDFRLIWIICMVSTLICLSDRVSNERMNWQICAGMYYFLACMLMLAGLAVYLICLGLVVFNIKPLLLVSVFGKQSWLAYPAIILVVCTMYHLVAQLRKLEPFDRESCLVIRRYQEVEKY